VKIHSVCDVASIVGERSNKIRGIANSVDGGLGKIGTGVAITRGQRRGRETSSR